MLPPTFGVGQYGIAQVAEQAFDTLHIELRERLSLVPKDL